VSTPNASGSAFVGVSLDSDAFSRSWVRFALTHILARHADLEFVLADRLLTYNKLSRHGRLGMMLAFAATADRIDKRRNDIRQFLVSETARLSAADRERVAIRTWDDYADASLASLVRVLTIAHAGMIPFQQCVERVVRSHFATSGIQSPDDETAMRLCGAYVIEETAMIIRITELAGRSFDYYPDDQIELLQALYENRFEPFGLTVESLTGRPRARTFTRLCAPNGVSVS
jgi:hypothetical protein